MTELAKTPSASRTNILKEASSSDPASDGITIGVLLETLAAHSGKQLVFRCEGREVRAGYHVTEVKDGQFSGLDCGANPESWRETFIQLWDVAENPERGFMPAGKFLAIMRKVSAHVAFDPAAKLTFELSDGVEPMRLYKASGISAEEHFVRVDLDRRPASCKPRDRWLAEQSNGAACCGSDAATQAPCCTTGKAA